MKVARTIKSRNFGAREHLANLPTRFHHSMAANLLLASLWLALVNVCSSSSESTTQMPSPDCQHTETPSDAASILALLRSGNCTGPSWRLRTLDLAQLPASEVRPLEGILCPAIVLSVETFTGVEELSFWSSWSALRGSLLFGQGGNTIEYDAKDGARFTYWDNATALASGVRTTGVASQGYTKVRGSVGAFLKRALSADGGRVRYGSSLASFSRDASERVGGRLSPLSSAGVDGTSVVGLWVSAAGVTSTFHFDRWDNLHYILTGEKTVRLAPPSLNAFATLGIRPCTHPHGRQARRAPAEQEEVESESSSSSSTRAISTVVTAGQAVFMPAGWLHELQAGSDGAAAALSLTSQPYEVRDFEGFIKDSSQHAPFIEEALAGDQSPKAFASALLIYMPVFLSALNIDVSELHAAFSAGYSADTLREAGIDLNEAPSLRPPPRCDPTSGRTDAEIAIIEEGARRVAARLRSYRQAVLPHYLLMYFDLLLTKVAGKRGVIGMLGWVHACLFDSWEAAYYE